MCLFDETLKNDFEIYLLNSIFLWLPKTFLENSLEVNDSLNNYYPNDSQIIYTANSYNFNDSFKIWTATQVSSNSKFIIGLHGGGPPFKFHSSHQYETDISDYYLVNGIGDKRHKHFIPVGQFWNRLKTRREFINGDILIVCSCASKYSFDTRSMLHSSHMPEYFKQIFTLL